MACSASKRKIVALTALLQRYSKELSNFTAKGKIFFLGILQIVRSF